MLLSFAVFVIPILSLAAWFRLRETHLQVEDVYRAVYGTEPPAQLAPAPLPDLPAVASVTPEVAFTRSLIALSQIGARLAVESQPVRANVRATAPTRS